MLINPTIRSSAFVRSAVFSTFASAGLRRVLSSSTTIMSKLTVESTIRMNSGYDIPRLALGVYQTPAEESQRCTLTAVKTGYRHIDSAVGYENEESVAAGLKASGVPREKLFFTTKVPPQQISYKDAQRCVDETLLKTGLDYVDLYLLHAPFGGKENRIGAWTALVEAVEAGKVRSIGVSNYGVKHLDELEQHIKSVEASKGKGKGGVISVNQIELHPWLPREDIVAWCRDRDVVLEAYSPLVRGQRMQEAILEKLGKKHNKSPAQILLRWSLQKDFVTLPKSVQDKRIEENAQIYDFELDEADMKELHMPDSYGVSGWDPTVHED